MRITFAAAKEENYAQLEALQTKKEQAHFVESVRASLEEARRLRLWRPVGIYVDGVLTGFAMYGLWENEGPDGRVWLDRFLIDEKWQGKGYGRAALAMLLNEIAGAYQCGEIYLSTYEENAAAIRLYESMGFDFNGEIDENGEKIMMKKLARYR